MEKPAEHLVCDGFELRRWCRFDVEAIAQAIEESRDHLLPWSILAKGDTKEVAGDLVAQALVEWDQGKSYKYAIIANESIAGGCGMMRRIGPGGLEIGYWLHRNWTGKGLATRAVAALLESGFLLNGVNHFQIRHDAANHSSEAVARRLEFVQVGRIAALASGATFTSGESGVTLIWQKNRP